MKQVFRLFLIALLIATDFAAKAQADSTCTQVSYTVTPGFFPTEMSYTVVNTATGAVVANGTGSTLSGIWCLPVGCYGVNMFDSFGDGWSGGSLNVFVMGESSYSGTVATGSQAQFMFGVGVGNCGTPDVEGCMDAAASNYSPLANVNMGCLYEGCTDQAATNFSPSANVDNGSCFYCNGVGNLIANLYICTFSNGNQVALDILNSAGDTVWSSPLFTDVAVYYTNVCLQAGECYTAVMSNNAGLPGWYDGYFWINNGQGQVINAGLANNLVTQSLIFSADGACAEIFGCTNPLATNYNADATIDDESCILLSGCTNPVALNYNPSAVVDDGTCFTGCESGNIVLVSYTPGSNVSDVFYSINDELGNSVMYTTFFEPAVNNTSYGCLPDDCYTLILYDWNGEAWDSTITSGVTINVNGSVFLTENLDSGFSESLIFGINSECTLDTVPCSTTIELVPDSLVEMENSVMIYWNEDLSAISSVTWDFLNGATSNEFYPTYFYDTYGTYTVCLIVYYNDGCVSESCLTFTMDANGVSGPGGAQMNGFWLNTTGTYPNAVAEMNAASSTINMFPNPTSGDLSVKVSMLNPSENTTIRIYSIDGKEVFANNFGAGSVNNIFQLNVSELSNGYYFLSLQNGNQIQRLPFVKE
ncbi:MAG: hypothetical protein RL664_232 [Bacteroidota bacterium]|jgi:hypothetical protein